MDNSSDRITELLTEIQADQRAWIDEGRERMDELKRALEEANERRNAMAKSQSWGDASSTMMLALVLLILLTRL